MQREQIDLTKLKIANYNRKSSESEDRQMLSIESQKDEVKRIAEDYKLAPFRYVFEESKSAKSEFERPEFNRMMAEIKAKNVDCIVCWKLDRLARNMTEGGMIMDLLGSNVIKAIITHDKVFYPNDNVLLMAVEFGQGKQYVKDLSVTVKRGQVKKASLGIPHGLAALGFLNDRTEERGNRKWILDEVRFNLIKMLFERFLTGTCSARKLHKYAVEELKLTTVKRKRIGGELIADSRIYEILKDPIYAGIFYYDGKRYELDKNLPRMITEDEHEKVQGLLTGRNIPKIQNHTRTYSGFISSAEGNFMGQDVKHQVICDCKKKFAYANKTHCPKCNIPIAEMNSPKYLSYTYYYDVKNKKKGKKTKSVSEAKIDESMKVLLKSLNFSPDLLEWSRRYVHELKDKEIGDKLTVAHNNEVLKEEYESKKARMRALLRDERVSDEEYDKDIKTLENQYKSTLKNASEGQNWYARLNEITNISECIDKVMGKGTISAKRELFSKLGSNLIWDEKNLYITNKKEIQAIVDAVNGIQTKFPEFEPKNFVATQGPKEKTPLENEVFSTMLLR